MIGLEYICQLAEMEHKELANKLGISAPAVSAWIRGKKKVPRERLKQLSEIFGVPEAYFQRTLSKADKAEIDVLYYSNKSWQERVEIPDIIYDDGHEYEGIITLVPDEAHLDLLKDRAALLRQKETLLQDVSNLIEDLGNFKRFRQLANILGKRGKHNEKDVTTIEALDNLLSQSSIFGTNLIGR